MSRSREESATSRNGAAYGQPAGLVASETLTLFDIGFAVAMSALPSPLRSPRTTIRGDPPTETLARAVNVPVPDPRRMLTLLEPEFATARSNRPSPSKSSVAIEEGVAPVISTGPTTGVPVALPKKMRTSTDVATARSGRPSPLKSPTATCCAGDGSGRTVLVPNPVAVPRTKVTVFGPVVDVKKARLPSALTSATVTVRGAVPTRIPGPA